MKKRLWAWLMTLIMIVTMVPATAFADTAQTSSSQIGSYFEVDDDNGALPGKPELTGNTVQSYANDNVKVNKTITATNEENVFDVNLSVTTKSKIDTSTSSPDAATVLVIDCSGSMAKGGRMGKAQEAAQTFINEFVAENATRKIAIVKFSGYEDNKIDGARNLTYSKTATAEADPSGWVDADELATVETMWNLPYCDAIGSLKSEGGTNIHAGLLLAQNLLNSEAVKDIENKNIILLTDGEPTFSVDINNADTSSVEVICEDGKNMKGTGEYTSCALHSPVEQIVPTIKNIGTGVDTYAVYVGNENMDCRSDDCPLDDVDELTDGREIKCYEWLAYCGFTTYSATDDNLDKIIDIFETILRIIELKAEAWVVTDPMGANIDFVEFNQEPNPVNEFTQEDGTITWDIKTGSLAETKTEDGVTTYTYNLSYKIKLDTLADGFIAEEYYNTNGVTGLTYLVTETKADGSTEYDNGTAYFNIPSVKGYAADFTFNKVGSFGEALPGAEFTLTKGSWSMTATADANGTVTFENVPSGHTYTLTETEAPNGYTKSEDSYTVTVSYGQVSIEGIEDGEALTIANESETIDIEGTKRWIDNGNEYKTRPESITVKLMADGEEYDSQVVSGEGNNWSYSFNDVPKYKGGTEVEYTVEEVNVEGYTSSVNGYNITNTIEQEYVTVAGTKTWVDPAGTTHPDITIDLLQNGEKIDSVTLVNGETEYSFTELPKYDENGQIYTYKVSETLPDSIKDKYNVEYSEEGYDITNRIKQETVAVDGIKTWIAPKGYAIPEITINLLQNGTEIKEVTLPAGTTTYGFTGLDKYNLQTGEAYEYTVTEDAVTGFTSEQKGTNFVNTIAQDYVSVSGTKTWKDPEGTTHPEITINLLRDGTEIKEVKLTDGERSYDFGSLPKYDLTDGHEYEYTVTEDPVEGYISKQVGNDFINTIEPGNTTISGVKTWIDPAGTEHPTVTIILLQNGETYDTKELAHGVTEYSFDVPVYDSEGQPYEYEIAEADVDGYTSDVDGYNVTNTIAQDYISVSGTKTWIAPEGTEIPDITINLLRDGDVVASTVIESGDAEYTFDELEKYDLEDGHVYEYTVEEEAVDGFTSALTGTDFTNTINQKYVTVSGTKTWVAPEGTEFPEITINLLKNGEEIQEVVLKNGETVFTFEELEAYTYNEDGTVTVNEYTVTEDAVKGYTSVIDGYNITNTIDETIIPSVQTGDDSNMWIYAGIALLALMIAIAAYARRQRQ